MSKLNCLWVTSTYRGDHSSDVKISVEPFSNETVAEFAERILGNDETRSDFLEIRLVLENKHE